jgi:glycosyltransferase involved in cell wall biosynthesis
MATLTNPGLLLFGMNYAPEEMGIGQHTAGLADDLGHAGWQVTTVTGIPHYPAWRRAPAPKEMVGHAASVVRRAHYVPRRQSLVRRGVYEMSWMMNCLPELIGRRAVDLVLGVVPSLGGGALAWLAGRRYRIPHVVMFQDLVGRAGEQSQFTRGTTASAMIMKAELSLARQAERVIIIAEGFRPYLVGGGVKPDRIGRVRNAVRIGSPQRGRVETRQRLGWADDEVVILHSGNMGFKQALDNVIGAAELARGEANVRFVLQGDGSQRERLQLLARRLALGNMSFLPIAPETEFPDILAAADILLVNQAREVCDMSLPSKLGSYLAVGLPVVAAARSDSEAGYEVVASGGGVVVEPERPTALLEAVKSLASNPARRRDLGAAGKRFAERELLPERTLQQMLAQLEMALAVG